MHFVERKLYDGFPLPRRIWHSGSRESEGVFDSLEDFLDVQPFAIHVHLGRRSPQGLKWSTQAVGHVHFPV